MDVPAAFGLLTRLPIPVDTERAIARGARAAWAYPLVGAVIGLFLAACIPLLLMTGLPGGIVAAIVLALGVIVTGAMHEDGLADSADGLWGGWDRDRRLAIMKDSHIGVYGVIAVAFSLLIRWLALVAIVASGSYWAALIAIGALSRCAMVAVMYGLPHARDGGLSQRVGRPEKPALMAALLLATTVAVLTGALVLIVPTAIAALACALIARAKICGQTGDILGATQQVTEIVLILTVVALINS